MCMACHSDRLTAQHKDEISSLNETMFGSRPIRVTAFVDWNAQIHNARAHDLAPLNRARQVLRRTARLIGRSLARQAPSDRFRVAFRLYHGWYKGWEKTDNFNAIMNIVSETDFSSLGQNQKVTFLPDVSYGHTLLSALPRRKHVHPPIHLPNTLRRQDGRSPPMEKMVDTALAADLLDWARNDPKEWALILSEDDDIVPPIFTAEAWIRPHEGRVFIVRDQRGNPGPFLKLDDLLTEANR